MASSLLEALSDENLRQNPAPLFVTLLFIFLLVVLPIAVFLSQKRIPFFPLAAPTSEMIICPSSSPACPQLPTPTYKVGGSPFNTFVILNPNVGNVVDAMDLVIEYDSYKLEVQDVDPQTSGVQIQEGNMFGTYVGNKVDACGSTNPNQRGKITLGGVSYNPSLLPTPPPHGSITQSGTFAIISFKPIAQGTANVGFDFTPNSTTDSNVVESKTAQDILAQVTNASFNIQPGQPLPTPTLCPSVTVTPTPAPTSTVTPTPTPTPIVSPRVTPSLTPPRFTPTPTPTPTPTVGLGCTQPDWDLDCDGLVCGRDASVLVSNWNKGPAFVCPQSRPDCSPDFNGDNIVNGADASKLVANWSVGSCP